DTAATIRGCIQALQAESPRIPSYAGLAERLRALAAALPEARWPQPEILDEEPEAIVAPLVETPVELTDMDLSRFLVESMAADEGETRAEATGESPAADPVGNAAPRAPEWSLDDAQAAFEPEVASFDAPSVEAPAASDEAFEIAAELSGDAVVSDAAGSAAWQLSDAPLADAGIEATQAGPVEEAAATSGWTVEAMQLEEAVAEPVQEPVAIEATSSDWSVEPVETAGLSGEIAASADTASVEDLAANAPSFEEQVGVESFEATPVEAVEAAPVEQTVEETTEETVAEDQAREPVAEAPVAGEQPVEEVVAEAPAAFAEEEVAEAQPVEAAVEAPQPEVAAPAAELPMLDFNELDRDLVDIFVEEGGDLLDHVDALLVELRADSTAREPIIGLQRDLHTLKGGARMAGIATIGDLGHVIESLLEAAAEHRTDLDRNDVQLLERGFDTLHQLLVQTRAHRATAMPDALIAAFEAR